jgi:hypothetical protein
VTSAPWRDAVITAERCCDNSREMLSQQHQGEMLSLQQHQADTHRVEGEEEEEEGEAPGACD